MKVLDIKGIIFDYGGTLDTRGDHWSEVLWQGYEHFGIGVADDEEVEPGVSIHKQAFRDAYVYGERALAVNPIVTPDFHFEDILREKLILELNFLAGKELLETGKDDSEKQAKLGNPGKDSDASSESLFLSLSDSEIHQIAEDMARYINAKTLALLKENKLVLEHLKQKGYPMVLVSNFYGNINQVLKDAGIDGYFEDVIESAVVGVRKPNPAIFALGVCALDLPASQVLVVGDTYGKDIIPAHKLGCHTLWIKGLQWEEKKVDESIPDGIIKKLSEMEEFLKIS
ncbi:HAD family hydrolase [Prevotella sp. AM23-5]|uniref:HAD family hydrolase n=1 Tax=Prevotellaceae TaxID=171552 RepID=UPI000E490EAB|nr:MULTISPECIES: HAD family hydrolase [Prevotellaceae]RHN98911.1 HAD family hydrolase [Prevotella sp. AM23-5]